MLNGNINFWREAAISNSPTTAAGAPLATGPGSG